MIPETCLGFKPVACVKINLGIASLKKEPLNDHIAVKNLWEPADISRRGFNVIKIHESLGNLISRMTKQKVTEGAIVDSFMSETCRSNGSD